MAWIRNRRLLTAIPIVAILVVAGFFGRVNPSAQAPSAAQSTKRVALVGGMLLTGYDVPPIHNAVVLIEGTKIAAIGTKAEVKIPPDAMIVDTSGKTMLPGLIEAHGHVVVLGAGDYASWFPWINAHGGDKMLTKVMETAAREMLMAGVTSEVDLGAPLSVLSVRDRINKGEIVGTRIFASGPWIARTRGGGDGGAMQVGFGGLSISSSEQAAAEVDRLAKAGVDLIKAHGGLTAADYKAIADAAHKNRIRVHAHVYAEQDVRNALENGIDVLQHVGSAGTAPPYSKELITDIANAGRPVVVTAAHRAWIYADTAAFPERLQNPVLKQIYPPDIYEEVQRSLANWTTLGYFGRTDREMLYRERGVKQFIESGAVMGMGTDSGTPMNFHSESLWREIKVHVDMGMTPLRAIQAATRVNAQILNRRDLGSIAPGQTADVIAVDGNPLFDIVALSHVDVVVKDGTVYKGGPAAANKPRTSTASASAK